MDHDKRKGVNGMKRRLCLTTIMAGMVTSRVMAQEMSAAKAASLDITHPDARLSTIAPEEYATGAMLIKPLFLVTPPSRTSGAEVQFEAGSRTLWHTHPLGQRLIVTGGVGWIQRWGDPIEEIGPGDVVWIPPDVKHWHGATPSNDMSHIALQDHLDGRSATWLEAVSDVQYRR